MDWFLYDRDLRHERVDSHTTKVIVDVRDQLRNFSNISKYSDGSLVMVSWHSFSLREKCPKFGISSGPCFPVRIFLHSE